MDNININTNNSANFTENKFYADIIEILAAKKFTKKEINKLKLRLCRKYHLKKIPTDIEIMLHAREKELKKIKNNLLTKPTRSISGVTPIAVMSAPYPCPHGKCIFCPGGPKSEFGNVPQSYTGREPSTMRAIRADYEPYIIVFNRLEQYIVAGHFPQKAEVIIQGGTFPSLPEEYQKRFVTEIYQALNDFGFLFFKKGKNEIDIERFRSFFELNRNIKCMNNPRSVSDSERQKHLNKKILSIKNKNLSTDLLREQKRNETAKIRCVGLTIETKPDWGLVEHGNKLLQLGVTRIELGVQSVYDEQLRITNRHHTCADTIRSIRELKDLGFKLNFHYMIGLPKTTKEMDSVGLRELFSNQLYRPDMLKIYPCMVLKGTQLYNLWKSGLFQPMTTATAAEIIADFMRYVPDYCRIMRVQRDIPTCVTEAGVDKTNLRQYVEKIMQEKNIMTKDIRAHEAGAFLNKLKKDKKIKTLQKPMIVVEEYEASDGKEFFIMVIDTKNEILYGFVRMRFPSQCLRKEITAKSALIRELHVFGEATALGKKGTVQHKGLGKQLMKKAEEIAKQHGKEKIAVLSAVGVKEYYKKLGYKKEGVYMVKWV